MAFHRQKFFNPLDLPRMFSLVNLDLSENSISDVSNVSCFSIMISSSSILVTRLIYDVSRATNIVDCLNFQFY